MTQITVNIPKDFAATYLACHIKKEGPIVITWEEWQALSDVYRIQATYEGEEGEEGTTVTLTLHEQGDSDEN